MKSAVYWLMTYICFLGGVVCLALLAPLADALKDLPGHSMSYTANFFIAMFFLVPLGGVFFFLALFFRNRARHKL
jgi:urea transporter